ncbi:MAG: pyruvate kinase [Candidatus Eremiobacter antarcticus]|nr:pyruvate kinase [Candidatus Eremiobacteraeota bacterium]MBC5809054.1 pyruvate kinase [Candidatus Eremiobacteraeota bacterium]PZR64286.1 MAG: pyruvate kinase [Candidatus Eremiobacter sp. RRmetagenome_bin22]
MSDFRRTRIVATMGPSCQDAATVAKLIEAGVDVFRINLSHATHTDLARWTDTVRRCERDAGRAVAILADLQGPKLRVGAMQGHEPVALADGATLEITTEPVMGTSQRISTTYANLARDVKPGDRILLDDGRLELRVDSATGSSVNVTVLHGGLLGEHKGMNLPNVAVSSPSLTEKDKEDLAQAVAVGVDFIALSFVRSARDVVEAKAAVARAGADTPVVAKIEKPEAIEHLEEILDASDAVMVARGDLGVEMAPERVPTLQKQIILRARAHLIPVITATQMLESMIVNPRPTRAEASDVANAIIDGTDAIMLSGETAAGRYPLEAVGTMVRIALEAEKSFPSRERRRPRVSSDSHAISHAACYIADSIDIKAIAAFTRTGFSARIVSKDRPPVPIYAFVPDDRIARRLKLEWAVRPCVLDFGRSTDELVAAVEEELIRIKAVAKDEAVVLVGGTPMGVQGRTNFLKIMRAD